MKKTAAPQLKPKGYSPENHDGKRYRVRDKDYGDGKVIVWGDDMTHEAAQRLKDIVTGRGKSRTARVESLDVIAKPNWVLADTDAARSMFTEAVGTLFGDPTRELSITNLDAPGQLASDQTYQTIVPGELRSDAGLVTPTQSKAKDPALAAIHANILGQVRGTAQAAQTKADAAAIRALEVTSDEDLGEAVGDLLSVIGNEDVGDDVAAASELANAEFATLDGMGQALYTAFIEIDGLKIGGERPAKVAAFEGDTHWPAEKIAAWAELEEAERADFRYEAAALASGAAAEVAGAHAVHVKAGLAMAGLATGTDQAAAKAVVDRLYEALVPKTPTPTEAPGS